MGQTETDAISPTVQTRPISDLGVLINLSFLLDRPTGISTYAANVVPHLRSLAPTLLSPFQFSEGDRYHPIPTNLTPAFGSRGHLRRLLWMQFRLPRIYRQLNSTLIFSPVPEAPLWSNCRTAVMVHDTIPLRFPRLSPLWPYFRYYIPQVAARAERIICNSEATARDVVDYYGISASKIRAIPLAVDRVRFRPLPDETGTKQGLSTYRANPYFLYVGRHDPHKNLPRAIRAFAQLPPKATPTGAPLEFWLAGPSDRRYTPQLKALATELGVSKRVRFLDYVSDAELPRTIGRALALVFPSLWEGFGLPVLEAMACGTPAIASNLASIPEVAGDAALLVDPFDVLALAAAMSDIATDPKTRSQLRQAGLARAEQFSWAKTGARTAEVLAELL